MWILSFIWFDKNQGVRSTYDTDLEKTFTENPLLKDNSEDWDDSN